MPAVWWQLPGPARFLESAVHQVRQGNSLAVVLPPHTPAGLEPALRAGIEADGGPAWHRLRPVPDEPPTDQLFARFAPNAPPGLLRDAASLCAFESFAGHAIVLRDTDDLSDDDWSAWREFLAVYAHSCRQIAPIDRTRFVVLLNGRHAARPPAADVTLAVVRPDDAAGPLDQLVHVTGLLRNSKLSPIRKALTAAVIAAVALWDPAVAERLAEEDPLTRAADPTEPLRRLAAERGWVGPPGADARSLGRIGKFEGRECRHSACLAVDPAGARELRRRVWAAQVGVLLPFVELRRQALVEEWSGRLRGVDDVSGLEIGQLEFAISRVTKFVPAEVTVLKKVRNELAHLRPVGLDVLREHIFEEPTR